MLQQHLIFFLAGWSKGCLNQATKYCTFTVSNNLKEYEDHMIKCRSFIQNFNVCSDTKQIWENTHYGFSLINRNRRGHLSQLNNIVNLQMIFTSIPEKLNSHKKTRSNFAYDIHSNKNTFPQCFELLNKVSMIFYL